MLRIVLAIILTFAFFGAPESRSQLVEPTVTVAVAPMFIPWMFYKTGVGQVTVEVKINSEGRVTSAKCVAFIGDLPYDRSFEDTAMRWHFSPANDAQERTVGITFVLRIMPKGTRDTELASIYSAPYQMEVRHTVFEPQVISDPLPIDTQPKKRP